VAQQNLTAEFVLVDDGSRDGTRRVLEELAAKDSRVKAIFFRRNFGQTAALSAGIEFAQYEFIVTMDGDLQNDPGDIHKLLDKLDEGYDMVSGWRKDRKDALVLRKIPSWIANRLIAKYGGVQLHDYGCALKAYRAEFVKDVRLYGEMHRFIPIYVKWQGARISEIVVTHHAREFGQSKYGIDRTLKVVFDLLLIKFMEKYFQKPIYLFGFFSVFALLFSFISFGLMLFFKLADLKDFVETPLPALTVTFFLIGVLSFLMGLQAEMNSRIYFESQNRRPYDILKKLNVD
jgi:glycosyltransferase involved in cell wall biosynthesis